MHENIILAWKLLPKETLNTLYMVFSSFFFASLLGLPLGIGVWLTRPQGLKPSPIVFRFLSIIINSARSIPFAIFIIAVIPFTRFLMGTSVGTTAAIVPLSLAGAPFAARIVEGALKEMGWGLVEAAQVMGARPFQIIKKVLVPEAFPSLISGASLLAVNLVGYSALAGLVGGGGLGKVAIQYGYQRFNGFLMIATLLVLFFLVEGIELAGRSLRQAVLKRRGIR